MSCWNEHLIDYASQILQHRLISRGRSEWFMIFLWKLISTVLIDYSKQNWKSSHRRNDAYKKATLESCEKFYPVEFVKLSTVPKSHSGSAPKCCNKEEDCSRNLKRKIFEERFARLKIILMKSILFQSCCCLTNRSFRINKIANFVVNCYVMS